MALAKGLLLAAFLLVVQVDTAPSPLWNVLLAYNASAAVDGTLLEAGLHLIANDRHGCLAHSQAGFWLVSAANRGRGLFRHNATLEAEVVFRELFADYNITAAQIDMFKVCLFVCLFSLNRVCRLTNKGVYVDRKQQHIRGDCRVCSERTWHRRPAVAY
jgi:hypothetical protein